MISVEESVYEANRQRGGKTFVGSPCPTCGQHDWHARNSIDSRYASQYNPGEYVEFTCAACGYSYEEGS